MLDLALDAVHALVDTHTVVEKCHVKVDVSVGGKKLVDLDLDTCKPKVKTDTKTDAKADTSPQLADVAGLIKLATG